MWNSNFMWLYAKRHYLCLLNTSFRTDLCYSIHILNTFHSRFYLHEAYLRRNWISKWKNRIIIYKDTSFFTRPSWNSISSEIHIVSFINIHFGSDSFADKLILLRVIEWIIGVSGDFEWISGCEKQNGWQSRMIQIVNKYEAVINRNGKIPMNRITFQMRKLFT